MIESRAQNPPLLSRGQIDHHVADLTVTAAGNVTLNDLQNRLAAHNHWLPIDGDPSRTLRELIEENSTGPMRLGFGGWRDLLLGMQFRIRHENLITVGGRAMKNVAGYDLTKFLIGSRGKFGRIETITARIYRRPAIALIVEFDIDEKNLVDLMPTMLSPAFAMLADNATHCGYFGDEATIDFYESELTQTKSLKRQSIDENIAWRARRWLPPRDAMRFRASLPPSSITKFCREARLENFGADLAFGIVVGRCDDVRHIRNCAGENNGRVFLENEESQPSPPMRNLLQNLHAAFQ